LNTTPHEETTMNAEKVESLITAALRQRVESFEKAIKEANRSAALPDQRKPPETKADGTIVVDITPAPEGFAMMSGVFATEAEDARKLADAIEQHGLLAVCKHGVQEDNQDAINRSIADHERYLATLDEDGQPIHS
jgi:hypothetical protein